MKNQMELAGLGQLPTKGRMSREQRTFVRVMYLHHVAMDNGLTVGEMYVRDHPRGDYTCTNRECERIDSHDPRIHEQETS